MSSNQNVVNPELSIIIVSYNTASVIRECLLSIVKQTRCTYECIVVDNASRDNSCLMIQSEFPEIRLITNPINKGFAAANNQGLQIAKGQYLVFLNSDTLILNSALDMMLATIQNNKGIGILGPFVYNADGISQQASVFRFPTTKRLFFSNIPLHKALPFKGWESHAPYIPIQSGEVEVISGCCMMMPTSLAREIGGMNEAYFMYSEELDLCKAVQLKKYSTYYDNAPRIIHLGGASTHIVSEKMAIELLRSMMKYLDREDPKVIRWARYWYIAGSCWRLIVWLILAIIGVRSDEARQKWKIHRAMIGWLFFRFEYK